ncbi:MAG: prepilin-type N-terminal cleavage/methylation domain-containing protein [Verrucomicrobiota bacterium]
MTQAHHSPGEKTCRGFTMAELLIVLTIVAAVAGMALALVSDVTVPGIGGRDRTPEEIGTLASMREVQETIVGKGTAEPGFRQDLGRLPDRVGELLENFNSESSYDPALRRGWRGPYLFDTGARYGNYIESGDGFPDNADITGIEDDPAILDGWGKPLRLQQPDTDDARLVSAGPNQIIETDNTNAVDADRGDDIILFLLTEDPNL